MWAVILIVALALGTFQASPDLSTNTNSIAFLYGLNSISDSDGFSYDLMAYADWQWRITPATVDGMYVAAADATAFDLDVDIVLAELLGFEL
jgi:hypothetical protein